MNRKFWLGLMIVFIATVVFGLPPVVSTTGTLVATVPATSTTYTDTKCQKGATCQYYVTATTSSGQESGPSNTVSVLNNGPQGTITLNWSAGTCPTGSTCGTVSNYNVYGLYPPANPTGLAGVSN